MRHHCCTGPKLGWVVEVAGGVGTPKVLCVCQHGVFGDSDRHVRSGCAQSMCTTPTPRVSCASVSSHDMAECDGPLVVRWARLTHIEHRNAPVGGAPSFDPMQRTLELRGVYEIAPTRRFNVLVPNAHTNHYTPPCGSLAPHDCTIPSRTQYHILKAMYARASRAARTSVWSD